MFGTGRILLERTCLRSFELVVPQAQRRWWCALPSDSPPAVRRTLTAALRSCWHWLHSSAVRECFLFWEFVCILLLLFVVAFCWVLSFMVLFSSGVMRRNHCHLLKCTVWICCSRVYSFCFWESVDIGCAIFIKWSLPSKLAEKNVHLYTSLGTEQWCDTC